MLVAGIRRTGGDVGMIDVPGPRPLAEDEVLIQVRAAGHRKRESEGRRLALFNLPVINSRFVSLYRDPNEDLDREYTLWENAQLRTNFSWLE